MSKTEKYQKYLFILISQLLTKYQIFTENHEKNSIDLKFAEEDKDYINICTSKKVERNSQISKIGKAIYLGKRMDK